MVSPDGCSSVVIRTGARAAMISDLLGFFLDEDNDAAAAVGVVTLPPAALEPSSSASRRAAPAATMCVVALGHTLDTLQLVEGKTLQYERGTQT